MDLGLRGLRALVGGASSGLGAAIATELGAEGAKSIGGDPSDVGRLAALLLSPAAAYVTGAMVPIDGGMIRALP